MAPPREPYFHNIRLYFNDVRVRISASVSSWQLSKSDKFLINFWLLVTYFATSPVCKREKTPRNLKSTLSLEDRVQRHSAALVYTTAPTWYLFGQVRHNPEASLNTLGAICRAFLPFSEQSEAEYEFSILFQKWPPTWNSFLVSSCTYFYSQFIRVFKTSTIWSMVRYLK